MLGWATNATGRFESWKTGAVLTSVSTAHDRPDDGHAIVGVVIAVAVVVGTGSGSRSDSRRGGGGGGDGDGGGKTATKQQQQL